MTPPWHTDPDLLAQRRDDELHALKGEFQRARAAADAAGDGYLSQLRSAIRVESEGDAVGPRLKEELVTDPRAEKLQLQLYVTQLQSALVERDAELESLRVDRRVQRTEERAEQRAERLELYLRVQALRGALRSGEVVREWLLEVETQRAFFAWRHASMIIGRGQLTLARVRAQRRSALHRLSRALEGGRLAQVLHHWRAAEPPVGEGLVVAPERRRLLTDHQHLTRQYHELKRRMDELREEPERSESQRRLQDEAHALRSQLRAAGGGRAVGSTVGRVSGSAAGGGGGGGGGGSSSSIAEHRVSVPAFDEGGGRLARKLEELAGDNALLTHNFLLLKARLADANDLREAALAEREGEHAHAERALLSLLRSSLGEAEAQTIAHEASVGARSAAAALVDTRESVRRAKWLLTASATLGRWRRAVAELAGAALETRLEGSVLELHDARTRADALGAESAQVGERLRTVERAREIAEDDCARLGSRLAEGERELELVREGRREAIAERQQLSKEKEALWRELHERRGVEPLREQEEKARLERQLRASESERSALAQQREQLQAAVQRQLREQAHERARQAKIQAELTAQAQRALQARQSAHKQLALSNEAHAEAQKRAGAAMPMRVTQGELRSLADSLDIPNP